VAAASGRVGPIRVRVEAPAGGRGRRRGLGAAVALCDTPCVLEIDPADGGSTMRRDFVVRQDGFADAPFSVDLAKPPAAIEIALEQIIMNDPTPAEVATPGERSSGRSGRRDRPRETGRADRARHHRAPPRATSTDGDADRRAAAPGRPAAAQPRGRLGLEQAAQGHQGRSDRDDRPVRGGRTERDAVAVGVCALIALVLGIRGARAEDAATRDAKKHYAKGDKLFALGKFDQALVEFEAAYEAKPLPKLLFNIGQAHRNLDHYDQAIFAFRKYLREVPDADNREAVEKLIDDLEARQAAAEERERERQAELDRERERELARQRAARGSAKPIYTRWWFWGGLAAVAGAGAGGYLLLRDDGLPSTDLGNVVFD
jgi:hypothetical protein